MLCLESPEEAKRVGYTELTFSGCPYPAFQDNGYKSSRTWGILTGDTRGLTWSCRAVKLQADHGATVFRGLQLGYFQSCPNDGKICVHLWPLLCI